jgi:hypothetical protein
MQNWQTFFKSTKLDDGTIVFSVPINQKAKLHMVDIDDMGSIVREILNDPEKFIGQDICICGEAIPFEDVAKIFQKVTGIPAISKTLTEQQFRSQNKQMPKLVQDELFDMFQWFEHYGCYGKDKDWTNGQKLIKLTTFEEWLTKTGWKGD